MCPVPRAETVYRDVLRLAEWVGHRLTSSWISSSVQVLMSRHGGGRAVPASLSFEYSTPHRRPHRRCGLPWRVARRPRCSRRTGRRSLPLSSTRDGLVRYGPLVSPPGQALARYPMSVIDCCGRYARSSLSPPRFRWRKGQCFADPQTRAIDDDQLPLGRIQSFRRHGSEHAIS